MTLLLHPGETGPRDWTRPHGIHRPDTPPDDELTELACQIRGQLDGLAADIKAMS